MANSVAVIGATGYRPPGQRGGPGFLCNSLDESFTKSSFLKMADALRVLVMDAEKLKESSPLRLFAPLAALDVVITDAGEDETGDPELPSVVREFCKEAAKHGTAVVVVPASR
jgi:DeoR/GlpR family transcriptional regulator of sugar metabolism